MAKNKISVTVDTKIVERVDQLAGPSTRSQVVEEALSLWIRNRRNQRLMDEVEQYYSSMDEQSRSEDETWAEMSHAEIAKTWA